MKVFAIATILVAAVSAAPTKDVYPPPTGAIPPYGVVSPPLNGVTPLLNGVIPPDNGGSPPGGNDGVNKNTLPPLPPVTGNKSEGGFSCPSGLYSNPQCCSVGVLGVADLDCNVPSRAPSDGADFEAICAAAGKEPQCCVVPILGQAVLCQDVIGAK
ncbi:fungal hydrophobin domain-containing protein [Trichoderma austrokoningii]